MLRIRRVVVIHTTKAPPSDDGMAKVFVLTLVLVVGGFFVLMLFGQ